MGTLWNVFDSEELVGVQSQEFKRVTFLANIGFNSNHTITVLYKNSPIYFHENIIWSYRFRLMTHYLIFG